MKLYLMRHGQAASAEVDPQQGLTDTGKADIEKLANRLAGQGINFSQVFHSDKARAQQTAEIITGITSPSVQPQMRSGLKPNDDPKALLPDIKSWQQDTLITSHLPFVPGLLVELTGEGSYMQQGMAFVPGTIICLAKDNNNWQLQWVESP